MQSGAKTPNHIWPEIQKLGVFESVATLREYERLITIGTLAAEEMILDFHLDCFASDAGETIHRLVFEEVHPWPGEYRRPGQVVIIGGYPGAESWRIERELQLLEIQTNIFSREMQFSVETEAEMVALVCAFHHIRFERIHPFRDGNGRVGRLLLGGSIRERCSSLAMFEWSSLRDDYMRALKEGNRAELGPLANFLLKASCKSATIGSIRSPFRVAPRMFESIEETDIEDDLHWSLLLKR